MDIQDRKRIARHALGFFTVCVYLVGVPRVIELAVVNVTSGAKAFTCTTAGYQCPNQKKEDDPEKLAEMTEKEFEFVSSQLEAYRKRNR